ncbi:MULTISPECIES: DeoR/GlpR family DNA-binding transcription regulator [Providencia]|uniref:DeoR/GlpR family DNA-binding transcription regulator n=1 Tax=Providencia TaxID=586 RepID=UPI001981CC0E|nr:MULTISPECIES: DeoR/GlpR family DNA-binding transcription regulator [Providencia]HEC8329030.1 DeoR/GlpR transcriptional regulator [Providencia rettgeri]MBN4866239.1 DeoR/GlpR transcriptional regulator [Providencia stuartii]MBN4875568.1 DeoR/GlpR transcriptional regulator [Providencia stuartii]MBN4880260.1 DeoR/GlpR transcriptional regulator [Providencia stuartii]MBN4884768.1 DeoR/GlpR transcriptional regulator [Providencia stuartii]
MLQLERHNAIVALIQEHGAMRVNDLAERLQVSRETVRRDLTDLEHQGMVNRSHGGALLSNKLKTSLIPYYAPQEMPPSVKQGAFRVRTALNIENKTRMAKVALDFIQPQQIILLDGSSSSWFLARQLPEFELTVVTPSVAIIQTLMPRTSTRVVGLGGEFSVAEEAFFGETTIKQINEQNVDTLFFSCQGIDRDRGIYADSEAHAALLRQMFLISRRIILLVDQSKFGKIGTARVCGFGDIDLLITEKFDDPLFQKEMTWHNVKVITIN